MSLTLTPVLIQFVSWGTYFIGGLTALLLIILLIWHFIPRQRCMPLAPSVPPCVVGPVSELRPLNPLNNASTQFDVPLPPRWKNGRRLPPATGSSGRKPPSE